MAAEILANGFINEEAEDGVGFNPEELPTGPLAGGSPGRELVVDGIDPDPDPGAGEPSN